MFVPYYQKAGGGGAQGNNNISCNFATCPLTKEGVQFVFVPEKHNQGQVDVLFVLFLFVCCYLFFGGGGNRDLAVDFKQSHRG